MSYTGKLSREGRFWLITIDDVGITQARNLKEAEEMAVDLVEIMTGEKDPDVTLVLDEDQFPDVLQVQETQQVLEKHQAEYSTLLREAVASFTRLGLTGADIATALKLSPQRVSQLTKDTMTVREAVSRGVIKEVSMGRGGSRVTLPGQNSHAMPAFGAKRAKKSTAKTRKSTT